MLKLFFKSTLYCINCNSDITLKLVIPMYLNNIVVLVLFDSYPVFLTVTLFINHLKMCYIRMSRY